MERSNTSEKPFISVLKATTEGRPQKQQNSLPIKTVTTVALYLHIKLEHFQYKIKHLYFL